LSFATSAQSTGQGTGTDIPIIVITAGGHSERSVKAQLGDVDFLPKLSNVDALSPPSAAIVAQLISNAPKSRDATRSAREWGCALFAYETVAGRTWLPSSALTSSSSCFICRRAVTTRGNNAIRLALATTSSP